MSLLKTTFFSGISTGVSLICRLITNKIIAVYLGTNGMFLLGQLKDFINIGKIAGSLGSGNGIIKYVASYKDDQEKMKSFLSTSLKLHIYFSLLVCFLTFIFKDQLSNYLFNDHKFSNAIALLSFSFITVSIHSFFMAVFNGLKKIKTYITISIISTIIASALVVVLVLKFKLLGAFYALILSQFLGFIISILFIRKLNLISLENFSFRINKTHFKNLTKFSYMAIAAPVCMISATLFIRFFLNDNLGSEYAGSWEGMWRISAIYIMFLTTTFKFYLLPTFSEISGNQLKKEVFKVWTLSIPTIIIITLTVYFLKDFIIPLLFSKEFILINTILLFHLLGDAIKINSWVLGNILIAKANTKVFIIFQIGWAVIFCTLSIILIKTNGFVGVSIAYFLTYVLHFIAMNIYFRKLLWLKD
ncbi:O-antigen translocase [Psychroserpens jangbogonensis]|uniref:O-antigen translocase n=1 Tax=Psychroserpens jangbogonensis TaxID=1484460 RepID=UPI00053F008B|nr:O-antigen translocase [Psychroserpens jangbogonensis]